LGTKILPTQFSHCTVMIFIKKKATSNTCCEQIYPITSLYHEYLATALVSWLSSKLLQQYFS